MRTLSEVLGFAVLTGPLWLILLLLPLGIWIAWKLARRFTSGSTRLVVGLGVFLLFFCALFADEIAGRIYFNHLCATEAGVKVYRTIELPAEYWDEQGRPRFYVNRYDHNKLRYIFKDKKMVDAPELQYTWVTKPFSEFFHIEKDVLQIADRESRNPLGEYFLFRYWGGWIALNFSPNHAGVSCEAKDLDSWPLNIFRPATSTR